MHFVCGSLTNAPDGQALQMASRDANVSAVTGLTKRTGVTDATFLARPLFIINLPVIGNLIRVQL